MSREPSDAEVTVLLQKLGRRSRRLATVNRGAGRLRWHQPLFVTVVFLVVIVGERLGLGAPRLETVLLIVGGLALVEFYCGHLEKRIDALVALLREEGLLQNRLAASVLRDKPHEPPECAGETVAG